MLRQWTKLNSLKSCNLNSLCGLMYFHTTTRRFVGKKVEATENNHMSKISSLLSHYDREQEQKMLNILNNHNLNELMGYQISKARANKLLAWRNRYGSLKSLNEVFSIEGFTLKITEKFFDSLLQEPKTNDMKTAKVPTRTAPFVTPLLEAEQRSAITSAVSVRIGVNSITWCRLDIPHKDINSPLLLTHWQHHEITEKKLHISELIQRCLYINHLIPAADCYLFENPQTAQPTNINTNVEQQNINIQKSQVTAMLGYALTSRKYHLSDESNHQYALGNKTTNLPNVFYVRRFLPARLFNHLVGTERVSSEDTILNMMRTFYNTEEITTSDSNNSFSGCVQFPMNLREMFSNSSRYYREFLSQTLLLNLTFIRLVLLQDAKSIAAVTRSGNKNTATLE